MISGLVLTFLLQAQSTGQTFPLDALKRAAVPIATTDPETPVDDLVPLAPVVKDALIVGAGECTHGSREVFQLKHRLFRYLVERQGFTVFELEASMPRCLALDHYVLTGEGDPVEALKSQGFWTWSTEEVLDLIKWMRTYNADPTHKQKLRVVGVDMQDREGAFGAATAILKKSQISSPIVDQPVWLSMNFHKKGHAATIQEFKSFVAENREKVRSSLGDESATFLDRLALVVEQADNLQARDVLLDDFIEIKSRALEVIPQVAKSMPDLQEATSSLTGDAAFALQVLGDSMKSAIEPDYDLVKLTSGISQIQEFAKSQTDKQQFFQNAIAVLTFLANVPEVAKTTMASPRDAYMAENALWAVKTLYIGQKAMFWGHNAHVGRTTTELPLSCGRELDRLLGKAYVPIGFAFGSGSFQAVERNDNGDQDLHEFTVTAETGGSLDQSLSKVRHPQFFLDLEEPSLKEWAGQEATSRQIGAIYDTRNPEVYIAKFKPTAMFRGLIYIDKTTGTRQLKPIIR